MKLIPYLIAIVLTVLVLTITGILGHYEGAGFIASTSSMADGKEIIMIGMGILATFFGLVRLGSFLFVAAPATSVAPAVLLIAAGIVLLEPSTLSLVAFSILAACCVIAQAVIKVRSPS